MSNRSGETSQPGGGSGAKQAGGRQAGQFRYPWFLVEKQFPIKGVLNSKKSLDSETPRDEEQKAPAKPREKAPNPTRRPVVSRPISNGDRRSTITRTLATLAFVGLVAVMVLIIQGIWKVLSALVGLL